MVVKRFGKEIENTFLHTGASKENGPGGLPSKCAWIRFWELIRLTQAFTLQAFQCVCVCVCVCVYFAGISVCVCVCVCVLCRHFSPALSCNCLFQHPSVLSVSLQIHRTNNPSSAVMATISVLWHDAINIQDSRDLFAHS